jgi:hypothetical protein
LTAAAGSALVCVSKAWGDVSAARAVRQVGRGFTGGHAHIDDARKQLVQSFSFRGGQCAEEVILDRIKPRPGKAQLFSASWREFDDVAAAVVTVAAASDQLAFLKLVE